MEECSCNHCIYCEARNKDLLLHEQEEDQYYYRLEQQEKNEAAMSDQKNVRLPDGSTMFLPVVRYTEEESETGEVEFANFTTKLGAEDWAETQLHYRTKIVEA